MEEEARENGVGTILLSLGFFALVGGVAYYLYNREPEGLITSSGGMTSAQAGELAVRRARSNFPWMDTFTVTRVSVNESTGDFIVRVNCDGDDHDFVVTPAGQVVMESQAKANPLTFQQVGHFGPRGKF